MWRGLLLCSLWLSVCAPFVEKKDFFPVGWLGCCGFKSIPETHVGVSRLSLSFFFLAVPHVLQCLSSLTRDWSWSMAVKTQSPNHEATSELPPGLSLALTSRSAAVLVTVALQWVSHVSVHPLALFFCTVALDIPKGFQNQLSSFSRESDGITAGLVLSL